MLLPALTQARDKARAIFCISNHKQLYINWFNYSAEHADQLLPAKTGYSNFPQNATEVLCMLEGRIGNPVPDTYDPIWLKLSILQHCPSDYARSQSTTAEKNTPGLTMRDKALCYASSIYNGFFNNQFRNGDGYVRQLSQLRKNTQYTLVFFEAWRYQYEHLIVNNGATRSQPVSIYKHYPSSGRYKTHRNGFNACYADGSARASEITWYNRSSDRLNVWDRDVPGIYRH